MTQFVVDANVAIKWVLPESDSSDAFRLLSNNHQLLVPDFFFSEIGNVLWKRVCRGEISREYAHDCLTQIISTSFEIHASHLLIPEALEVAVRVRQAVYDCVYLALAVRCQCQMVTADERFYNALQSDVLVSYVCELRNLP